MADIIDIDSGADKEVLQRDARLVTHKRRETRDDKAKMIRRRSSEVLYARKAKTITLVVKCGSDIIDTIAEDVPAGGSLQIWTQVVPKSSEPGSK